MNVEVMHLYAHELMRPKVARAAANEAARHLMIGTKEVVFCALIDDYGSELTVSREEAAETLIWYAEQADVALDFVSFESDCTEEADLLLEQAGVPPGGGAGNGRWFERITEQSQSAVLVAADDYVACPTLAAVWSLARLGIAPYPNAIELYGKEGLLNDPIWGAERLLTVLPVKYMRTEATVCDLLKASGYAVSGKIGYAFY